jgi:hypothetical protein
LAPAALIHDARTDPSRRFPKLPTNAVHIPPSGDLAPFALLARHALGFRRFLRLALHFSAPRCFGLGQPLSLFSPSRLGGLSLTFLAHGAFGFRRCQRPAILLRATRRFGLSLSLGFLSPNRFRHFLSLTLLSRGAFSPRRVLGLPFLFGWTHCLGVGLSPRLFGAYHLGCFL